MSAIDRTGFRHALGRFATGVTIVTTRDSDGRPFGVTANSFNSVSLDPPMILWSLAKTSQSMVAFESAERFAVHVLREDQQDLSNRFASKGADKFSGLADDLADLPLLDAFAARFICRTAYRYEGGDHIIFVGQVIAFEATDEPPLLYHAGAYAEARPRSLAPVQGISPEDVRIGGDSLVYLIAQASTQVKRAVDSHLQAYSMQEHRFLMMSIVAQSDHPTREEVRERVLHAGFNAAGCDFDELIERGWLSEREGRLGLSEAGQQCYIELLIRLRAFEDDVMSDFTAGELADARSFLRRLIQRTSAGIPPLLD